MPRILTCSITLGALRYMLKGKERKERLKKPIIVTEGKTETKLRASEEVT